MADFKEVKEKVSLYKAAEYLGLETKRGTSQLRAPCPRCKSGGDRALALTEGKGFFCWHAKAGGDVIALTAHVLDKSPKDAADWLAQQAGIVPIPREYSSRKQSPLGNGSDEPRSGAVEEDDRSLKPLSYLEHDHAAVEAVGFAPDDAERIGVGYAPKGTLSGLVAIPVRLPTGELIGYVGVTEAKLPKTWRFPEEPEDEKVVRLRPKSA